MIVGHVKKKQQKTNTTELAEADEDKCDIPSVTDSSISNKDKWIIDSGYSHNISSNKKMFSSYTSVHGSLHGKFRYK